MKLSLNKALKLKNIKVKKINTLMNRVCSNNSYLKGNTPAYDARKVLEEHNSELESLVRIKTAINKANVAITEKMVKIAELKGMAAQFRNLNTNSGVQTSYRSDTPTEFVCNVTQVEKDKILEDIEKEIEQVQEEIDYYNATTEIEI